jgi:hypothetical protein
MAGITPDLKTIARAARAAAAKLNRRGGGNRPLSAIECCFWGTVAGCVRVDTGKRLTPKESGLLYDVCERVAEHHRLTAPSKTTLKAIIAAGEAQIPTRGPNPASLRPG